MRITENLSLLTIIRVVAILAQQIPLAHAGIDSTLIIIFFGVIFGISLIGFFIREEAKNHQKK